jgi:hypothetical protein
VPFIFVVLFLCDGTRVQQFCCIKYLLTFVLILSAVIMLSVYSLVADFLVIITSVVPRQGDHHISVRAEIGPMVIC